MKSKICFVLLICYTVGFSIPSFAQPTIYLVRHAEKVPTWLGRQLDAYHPLSAEGVTTALEVSKYFKSKSIAGIFSSTTTRTLHTALPLSKNKNITIQTAKACMDTSAIDGFLKQLKEEFTSDQTVVMFSHSNIIPYLLIKSALPEECYANAGIVKTHPTWLLIEGYDHIWRIEPGESKKRECKDFQMIRFK